MIHVCLAIYRFSSCVSAKAHLSRERFTALDVGSNRRYFWLGAIKLSTNVCEITSNDLIYKPTDV